MKRVCDMKCFECRFEDCINDYVPPLKKRNPEKAAECGRRRYERCKALGLCVRCGKPAQTKPTGGKYVRCLECKLRQNRRSRENYRAKHEISREIFREYGCYFCGEPCAEGKKVCQHHLEICRATIARTMANARAEGKRIGFEPLWFGKYKKPEDDKE